MSRSAPRGWGYARGQIPAMPASDPDKRTAKDVAYWLGTLRYIPSPLEIAERWHVSRSSASKWHAYANQQFRIYQGLEP